MKRTGLNWTAVALLALLVAAFAIRVYGINFPRYHWDENIGYDNVFYAAFNHLALATYVHGSFYQYLMLVTWSAYLALQGIVPTTQTLMTAFYGDTVPLLVLARSLPVLAGTANVAVVYALGRRLYGPSAGLLAAFFLSFTFLNVSESHYARGHVLSAFLATLAIYFCVRILEQGRTRDYVLAGISIGLAAAAQYSALLALAPLVLAHWAQVSSVGHKRGWRIWIPDRALVVALDSVAIAFFLVTPYALVEFTSYVTEMKWFISEVINRTWVSPEGQPVIWFYINEHLRNGIGAVFEIVAFGGLAYALYRRTWKEAVLFAFPALLLISIAKGENFARYALPLLPFLAIASARWIADVAELSKARLSSVVVNVALVVIAVGLMSPSILNALRFDYWLTQPDTRFSAAEWIAANVPPDATIVVEGAGVLGPPVPVSRRQIESRIANQPGDTVAYVYLETLDTNATRLPGYSVETVFRLDQRHENGSIVGTIASAQYYAARGVDYLVTVDWMQRDAADYYAPEFERSLNVYYEQVADFEPTITFRFDPYAWRMDYDALARISIGQPCTGGPHLRIYRRRG